MSGKASAFGISLIELGLALMIISLALAPVVRMMGGPATSNGNAVQVTGTKSREIILANTILDKALATDYSTFNCGGTFNPKTSFPAAGQSKNLPTTGRCAENSYSQTLFYQWTVRNMDPTGQEIPVGNHYYAAVLNIWEAQTGGSPIISLPTAFYWNEAGVINNQGKTGVIIALDQSNSMAYGKDDVKYVPNPKLNTRPMCLDGKYPGSPYLRYRYKDPTAAGGAYSPPGGTDLGDLNTNANLDVVSLWNTDDLSTDWLDTYLRKGTHSVPSNCNVTSSPIFDFTGSWRVDDSKADAVGHVQNLCNLTAAPGSATWNTTLNENLSRMEVARSSLLSFLLAIEDNADLYLNTKLAFMTYSSEFFLRSPLQSANSQGRYVDLRRKFTWINRSAARASSRFTDNGPILPISFTNMYEGVKTAANTIFADKTLDSRIILIVGDGIPECAAGPPTIPANCPHTPAVCEFDHIKFQQLAKQIGGGTYPGSNGNKATIFSLGLMDPNAPAYLRDDLALNTPGGQFFQANSIYEVKPVFDQIQYQVQRIILLNKVSRYNVNFD